MKEAHFQGHWWYMEQFRNAVMFVCAAVHKSHAEVEAMRRQAKGLAQEYDRLLTEHHQLQVKHTDVFHMCVHQITNYSLYITWVILFSILYLVHRISRVLQTKRISNHRSAVAIVFRCCLFHLFHGCSFFSLHWKHVLYAVDQQRPCFYYLLQTFSFEVWTEAHF